MIVAVVMAVFASDGWTQSVAQQIRPVYSAEELETIKPKSPNPYLAFLPEDVEPDWDYWDSWMAVERQERLAGRAPRAGIPIGDVEPNNLIESSQSLTTFGTAEGKIDRVTISGFAGLPPEHMNMEPIEDNGSIEYAPSIPLSVFERFCAVSGAIGNGPFASDGYGTGDFDFYALPDLQAGRVLEIQVDASRKGSSLDPALVVYNSAGTVLATASNDLVVIAGSETVVLDHDATLRVTVPAFGDYYVAVFGESEAAPGELLGNPFSSQTGPGVKTEGPYDLYLRLFDPVSTTPEENGSINLATPVPSIGGVYSSIIGNGETGSSTGDFDFYAVQDLTRGDLLIADVDATLLGSLNSFVAVWDSTGKLVAWNDDDPFHSIVFTVDEDQLLYRELDSFVAYEVPADGTYYVSVGSFGSPYPLDPFDVSSGVGPATTGPYELALRVQPHDPDVFGLDLKAGDIVGADLTLFNGNLELLDPSGTRIVGSHVNLGAIYPGSSPLPFGEDIALAYVIPEAGRYYLRCSSFGQGDYMANLSVHRPVLESDDNPEPRQRLFIDFNGVENFDTTIFGGEETDATIGGLDDGVLARWELEPEDRDAVIDAILDVVVETLRTDLQYPGGKNPLYDIEILNSRDDEDPWGDPDVSRVVVGGTIAQLDNIQTIGIAESIDVGNFDTTESAVVLLDLLSAAENDPNSLNGIPLRLSAHIIDLIGEAVGNIVAHEAGHFFGCYHTENFITLPSIMDQGGNLANTIGLGADGEFGSGDDLDVDFGVDQYVHNEGFTGFEDTLNLIALALPAPPGQVLYVDFSRGSDGIGTLAFPFNNMVSGFSKVPHGGTLRVFPGTSSEVFQGSGAVKKRVTVERYGPGNQQVIIGRQ